MKILLCFLFVATFGHITLARHNVSNDSPQDFATGNYSDKESEVSSETSSSEQPLETLESTEASGTSEISVFSTLNATSTTSTIISSTENISSSSSSYLTERSHHNNFHENSTFKINNEQPNNASETQSVSIKPIDVNQSEEDKNKLNSTGTTNSSMSFASRIRQQLNDLMRPLNPLNYFRRGRKPSYDFLLFSIQWPIHLCEKQMCIRNPKQNFGIHGLWPNSQTGRHPMNCNPNDQLDPNQLDSISNELRENWFTVLQRNSDFQFWSYEWSKHGTCARNSKLGESQFKYFATALELFHQNPVGQWLSEAGINPSSEPDRFVELNAIGNAIGRYRLDSFTIKCKTIHVPDERGVPVSVSSLESINFCYDKQLRSISCPDPRRSNCPRYVLYPTYRLTMQNYGA